MTGGHRLDGGLFAEVWRHNMQPESSRWNAWEEMQREKLREAEVDMGPAWGEFWRVFWGGDWGFVAGRVIEWLMIGGALVFSF